MTYQETIEYLFNVAPLFQNIGQGAYKEGLSNTHMLDEHFGHPHRAYHTIHVAGTNGKGSCSHTIAAILQSAGYRVGLYTSPHLIDFRERIRVNGEMISEQRVIDFVEKERPFFEPLYPSFFELATALAFLYFKEQKVDVAVIEVGLGGRLDCTNIIQPDLSVITNISFDHTQFLGHTLAEIANEKAGIIKTGIPVVIGETNGHKEVKEVFTHKSLAVNTSLIFADETNEVLQSQLLPNGNRQYETLHFDSIIGELGGDCQVFNTATILTAILMLRKLKKEGKKGQSTYMISDENVREGFLHVCEKTGLMGRWQRINEAPLTICDTGHNTGGLQYIAPQLAATPHRHLHMVIGMVGDKDVRGSLSLLPSDKDTTYYFTQATVKRAMPAQEICRIGNELGLQGAAFNDVMEAYQNALSNAQADDLIYIGGSSFIVADFLTHYGR